MTDQTVNSVDQRLRRLIMEGHYKPGTRLVEERLAQELGVSRTPIRQALARAAAEGLIDLSPNRGATVRRFTRADLIQAFDLRAVLEGHAAHAAASRISPEQLALLDQTAAVLEQALDQRFATHTDAVYFLVAQNQVFHSTVLAASGNLRLAALLPQVVDVPLQFRSFYWYSPAERQTSNFFHRSILAALKQQDGDRARGLMIEHILSGRDFLLQSRAALDQKREDQ